MKERVKFINFFEALKKVDFVTDDIKYDRDLARWAFQIVTTRAFPDETTGEYHIVPMADMVRDGIVHLDAFGMAEPHCFCYPV